jgi:hypothetical protein
MHRASRLPPRTLRRKRIIDTEKLYYCLGPNDPPHIVLNLAGPITANLSNALVVTQQHNIWGKSVYIERYVGAIHGALRALIYEFYR